MALMAQASTSIDDLPDETLLQIFNYCLDKSTSCNLINDYTFCDGGSGSPHYLIEKNYGRYVDEHGWISTRFLGFQEGNPYMQPMARRFSQKIHAILRLVCRKWYSVARRIPVMIDLLIEKHRKTMLMQNFIDFPYMPKALLNSFLVSPDYWKVKAIEQGVLPTEQSNSNVNCMVNFWKQRPRIAFRVFCLSWNYARGLSFKCMRGKIDTLCIGYPGQRASHIWESSYTKLCEGLAIKNIEVVNLRSCASPIMTYNPDLQNLPRYKAPTPIPEVMRHHHLKCDNLVWEFLPPFLGSVSDLNVFVPMFSGCLVLTSGSNTVSNPRKRAGFFKEAWNVSDSSLPAVHEKRKGAANVRAVETIVLQHIVIESLEVFFDFFPRLKRIKVFSNVFKSDPDGNLHNFFRELLRTGYTITHNCSQARGTFIVY